MGYYHQLCTFVRVSSVIGTLISSCKMAQNPLPTRLTSQPILEAVFEVRFASVPQPLAAVLPGVLTMIFADRQPKIERLPASMMPDVVRQNDHNLALQPLIKVTLDGYTYLIGDRVLTLACTSPYPGWNAFSQRIVEILNVFVDKFPAIQEVARYSLKYVDFLVGESLAAMRELVKLQVSLGSRPVISDPFSLRTEIREDDFINIVSVLAPAQMQRPFSGTRSGLVIDIDLISESGAKLTALLENKAEALEFMHRKSKERFFDLLTDQALQKLGAEYE